MSMAYAAGGAAGSGRRWRRLADRPIRQKLAVLLAPPVVAVLALSGLIAYGAQTAASDAEQARRLVAAGAVAGELVASLQHERAFAALVFARHSVAPAIDVFERQIRATDPVAARFAAALAGVQVPAGLEPLASRVRDQLSGLALLREQVRGGRDTTASLVVFRYRSVIADLDGYRSAMSQLGVDSAIADGLRASAALSQATESLGLLQVNVLPALDAGTLTPATQQQVLAADSAFTQSIEDFRQLAPAGWAARLASQAGGRQVVAGERLQALAVGNLPDTPLTLGTNAQGFVAAVGGRMDQLHVIEHDLDADMLQAVTAQRDREWRQIGVLGGAVVVALAGVAALAWSMTRSMTRPLRALNNGATRLADSTLPDMVAKLTDGNADRAATSELIAEAGRLLPVTSRDEVGAVAAAFNNVAAVAARLAGEQAATRAMASGIVSSIARRLQGVVDQVTARLDTLESEELGKDRPDDDRLSLLFALDQKVTGAHRLVANLLVIADNRAGRPEPAPVPMNDVVKGAISRAEGAAERVRDGGVAPDCLIVADAVAEIVHLLTELLHNAVQFSPPDAPVTVSSGKVGDLLHIQIADHGVGISAERLPLLQRSLSEFDMATASRHMGLPVVGRIAARLSLQVTLRPNTGRGTCVDVVVPAYLVIDNPHRTLPAIRGLPAPALPDAAGPGDPARRNPTRTPPPALAPTRELPIAGTPPPVWPPVHPADAPTLKIFQTVVDANPWFEAEQGQSPVAGPALPAPWRDAASEAERVHHEAAELAAAEDRLTSSGLPKRTPGKFAVPSVAAAPRVPRQRDRETTRQGMAALTLARRSRRSTPSPHPIGWS